MATFKALNIESDDESDIEIDNTKEIQIEEGLKLYQDALKLHSEGPASYPQAAIAYRSLLDSEIFKYPEAQSELRRLEVYGPPPEQEDGAQEYEGDLVVGYTSPTEENALGTLPQLIHLAQKNYGQFLLESLGYKIRQGAAAADTSPEEITQASIAAINAFVEALDKDDTDPDVWRRTAVVGEFLGSQRISRYCLEAVLDGDDGGIEAVLATPALADTLAGQQLRHVVVTLQDQLSMLQAPLSQMKKRKLSKLLKQRLGTYDGLKNYQKQQKATTADSPSPLRSTLKLPKTWAELGHILLRQALSQMHATGPYAPGSGVAFDLAPDVVIANTDADAIMADDSAFSTSIVAPTFADQAMPSPPPQSQSVSFSPMDQFVGMDQGMPTAPVPSFPIALLSQQPSEAIDTDGARLPTRKRSGDAAGLTESAEAARGRSKRVRARESNVDLSVVMEDDTVMDSTQIGYALGDLDFVDNLMIDTVDNILVSLHLAKTGLCANDRWAHRNALKDDINLDSPGEIKQAPHAMQRAISDLYRFLATTYSDSLARVLTAGSGNIDSMSDTQLQPNGLSATATGRTRDSWPAMSESDGLLDFARDVNQSWSHINQVVLSWLFHFLGPASSLSHEKSSYVSHKWQDSLKTIIVRIIVSLDHYIYQELGDRIAALDRSLLLQKHSAHDPETYKYVLADIDAIQTLFELHLDIYSLIKEPNSGVEKETIITQGERTDRWANLSRDAMNMRSSILDLPSLKDELNLRYLWAATHHINVLSDVSREHTINCWQELRSIFVAVGSPVIDLQNNAVMPCLSIEAIDRELSRLTTQDFFVKIFDTDQQDYTVVIESLEPLLELLRQDELAAEAGDLSDSDTLDDDSMTHTSVDYSAVASPELVGVLKSGNISLRLSLWQRLRESYEKIDYQPMVVCCHFRILEMLVNQLASSAFSQKPPLERTTMVLKYLRLTHDLLTRILDSISKHDDALECMDMDRVESAFKSVFNIITILHTYTMYHDDVRVGLRAVPLSSTGAPLRSFSAVAKIFQEIQLHAWIVAYKILGEALTQCQDMVENPENLRFDFLRCVHNVLGARSLCGKSGKVFLKMLKQEYLRMRTEQSVSSEFFDIDFAQVLYDLYGLKVFLNPVYEQQEHHCQNDASADKHSAMQAVDLLLALSSKMKMTDLLKHPIRDTIEKVHALVTRKKPSEAIMKNRDVVRALLKSPINPSDLFQCVHGLGTLTLHVVPAEHAILAAKGWYFLMGYIHLSRFRSQKRTGPAATDDLDIAVALFMQELEYSMDNWETWFRIAQAYDSKIEEHVSWSAEKLSSNTAEITQLQKAAIHCYRMAVALAMRSAEPGPDTTTKLAELFADFAMRMYASTRQPFDMQAFSLGGVERYYSVETVVKGIPFMPVKQYVAWKIARGLFQRAIRLKPDKWILHYHLAKCTWKLFSHDQDAREIDKTILPEDVTNDVIKAIELLPTKKDPRRAPPEPILEPHYKLVSIVHKMVVREDLEPDEACNILLATPYASKVDPVIKESAWESYVLKVLKNLRTADKSHWHHRMIARTATIVYHDGSEDADVLAAKHELTQQMFTKTMQLQIWKPEHQRPGRHFVYSARYICFFTRLLDQLNDRASLDGLTRRVRKRQADIFDHATVWSDICLAYLKVLRNHGKVPLGHETAIFSSINHEDFVRRKELLENWCQDSHSASPTLDALQEALELKKINSGLMKAGAIDDLVGDAYAYLFDTVGRRLWTAAEAEDQSRRDEAERQALSTPPVVATVTGATSVASPARNPMMNLSSLMNIDGTSEVSISRTQQSSAMPTPTVGTPAPQSEDPQGVAVAQQSRRKIGVGRREIRMSAEALNIKSATAATNASTSTNTNARPTSKQEVQVVIHARPQSTSNAIASASKIKNQRISNASDNDDADGESNESELSDVDEELVTQGTPGKQAVKPKPLTQKKISVIFPGLVKTPSKRPDLAEAGAQEAEEAADDDDDEDEDNEEEEGNGEDEMEVDEPAVSNIGHVKEDDDDEEVYDNEEGEEEEEDDDNNGEDDQDVDLEQKPDDDDEDEDEEEGEEDQTLPDAPSPQQGSNEDGDEDLVASSSAAWHNQQRRRLMTSAISMVRGMVNPNARPVSSSPEASSGGSSP